MHVGIAGCALGLAGWVGKSEDYGTIVEAGDLLDDLWRELAARHSGQANESLRDAYTFRKATLA